MPASRRRALLSPTIRHVGQRGKYIARGVGCSWVPQRAERWRSGAGCASGVSLARRRHPGQVPPRRRRIPRNLQHWECCRNIAGALGFPWVPWRAERWRSGECACGVPLSGRRSEQLGPELCGAGNIPGPAALKNSPHRLGATGGATDLMRWERIKSPPGTCVPRGPFAPLSVRHRLEAVSHRKGSARAPVCLEPPHFENERLGAHFQKGLR